MAELTEAIEAAMHVMYGDHQHAENYRAHVQVGIAAAAPLIAADAIRNNDREWCRILDQAAEDEGSDWKSEAVRAKFTAEAYARGYGRGRDDEAAGMPVQPAESAPGAITAPPEGERTSGGAEALTGREEET